MRFFESRACLLGVSSLVLFLCLVLGLPSEALARFGGGGDFGGGGGGGGGGSSSGAELELILLLIRFCILYPELGVPLLLVAAVVVFFRTRGERTRKWESVVLESARQADSLRPRGAGYGVIRGGRERLAAGLTQLRAADPNFSEHSFEDLAQLVFRRATAARSTGDFSVVGPYLSASARSELERERPERLEDVIVGAYRLASASVSGGVARLRVEFEYNVTEDGTKLYGKSLWTFHRKADALSPAPERMFELRCVACGSPMETDVQGRCRACGTPLDDARLQWQVESIEAIQRRPVRRVELTLGGGVEVGTNLLTVLDPRLVPELRALCARHPDFEPGEFTPWVDALFRKMQRAWSALDWELARPHLTDPLFQRLRYQIQGYRDSGYRNHSADVTVLRIEYVRCALDPYYESITVRIRARMKDWTTDESGQIVGGSKRKDRTFSEYWTFVRSVGAGAAGVTDPEACPSCGGPLDKVSSASVCGYCGTRLASAEHSWVLSKIEQDEVYTG